MIKIITTIHEAVETINHIKKLGLSVGFVPTMGYFHDGHIELMKRSIKECGETFVSIFVNPIQFSPGEDLARYPRDLERDTAMAASAGVKYLFCPEVSEMYPEGFQTRISAGPLASNFCGASRPGHFDGVCTVVAKLFNIITPDRAYFGMKDYQQLVVIEKMAEDLNMKVKIIRCETVREKDGLAMSSRNSYLSPEERKAAPALKSAIEKLKEEIIAAGGSKFKDFNIEKAVERQKAFLTAGGFKGVDYLKVASADTLKEAKNAGELSSMAGVFIAAAAFIGKTRLIDNAVFGLDKKTVNAHE
ncbi:MAG: Pantothenate synthetase [bacterium ADurb.Bin243]|nr:MAG: Pantothenate synthetase [bacterium ADurb.Bin243]